MDEIYPSVLKQLKYQAEYTKQWFADIRNQASQVPERGEAKYRQLTISVDWRKFLGFSAERRNSVRVQSSLQVNERVGNMNMPSQLALSLQSTGEQKYVSREIGKTFRRSFLDVQLHTNTGLCVHMRKLPKTGKISTQKEYREQFLNLLKGWEQIVTHQLQWKPS